MTPRDPAAEQLSLGFSLPQQGPRADDVARDTSSRPAKYMEKPSC